MYREALAGILVILVDDGLTRQFRHTHDAVGIVHTVFLDAVDGGVHLSARAVEVCSVDVDAQRLSAHLLGVDASRIGQPVVCMDDVVVECACHHTCDNRVIVDFLMQVSWITTGKLHRTKVVDVHVVEISIQMVAQAEIQIRIHDVAHPFADIVG